MTNAVKLLLLLAAVLQQPGCVATRAPHEPYRPPIIEPLLYQPEPGAIYTAGADERLWEDRVAGTEFDADQPSKVKMCFRERQESNISSESIKLEILKSVL